MVLWLCLIWSLKGTSINKFTYNKILTRKRRLKCLTIEWELFKVALWGTELKCKETDKVLEIMAGYFGKNAL